MDNKELQNLSKVLLERVDVVMWKFKEDNNWDRIKTTDKLGIIERNIELVLKNSTLDKKVLDRYRVIDSMVILKALSKVIAEIKPDFVEKQMNTIKEKLTLYSDILFYSLVRK